MTGTPDNQKKKGGFILAQKCEDMIYYGYQALRHFPKSERHTSAAEIKKCMFRVRRLIITANKRFYKKNTLEELDIEKTVLMYHLRQAKNLGFLPFKKYTIWIGMLEEIGRMIGGWFKTIKK